MSENQTPKFPTANDINTIIREGGTELAAGNAIRLINELKPVYSKELDYQAEPVMRFYQFAAVKTELMTQPGNTIKMLTYKNLELPPELLEGERIKSQTLSSTMKEIVVTEHGTATAITSLSLQFSFVDQMANSLKLLGRNIGHVIECELRDTACTGDVGTSKIFGRKKDAAKISARNEIAAGANELSVATIKDAVEILSTNNAPKIGGNYYICFVHPHQSRTLRDDPAWINASNYGAPEQLFSGEIGRIDDVRFIETTMMPNGAAPAGDNIAGYKADLKGAGKNSIDVYQAVLFGEDYYAMAVALPPEIRTDTPQDFQRELKLGWYGIWGTKSLNPTHGVIIETA